MASLTFINMQRVCIRRMEPGSSQSHPVIGQGVMAASWNIGVSTKNIRRNFFMVRVTEHCNGLPRGVVGSPSLETFKICLDTSLCDLIKAFLLRRGRGIGLDDLARFYPNPDIW